MIVDVHAHYHPRAFHEALARMPGFGGGSGFAAGSQPVTDAEAHIQARLEMMADAGVSLQVLSPAAGWGPHSAGLGAADGARGVWSPAAGGPPSSAALAASTAAATIGNDLTAALAARLPERFKAL